jgi:Domain of unknown function (DUF4396)
VRVPELPGWLVVTSEVALWVAFACAAVIIIDLLAGHMQKMWIMDIVWPVTALYSGPLGLWAYYRIGRLTTKSKVERAKKEGEHNRGQRKAMPEVVAVAATHCGAGCTLGDIIAEWFVFAVPIVLFGQKIFGSWALDFAVAYLLGIAFQYFTIAPMRGLGLWDGLKAAMKADTLSLAAWQIGMYGWMAIVHFGIFGEIPKTSPVFWFMMQIGMIAGFVTAYPVNWWLVRAGWKEKM